MRSHHTDWPRSGRPVLSLLRFHPDCKHPNYNILKNSDKLPYLFRSSNQLSDTSPDHNYSHNSNNRNYSNCCYCWNHRYCFRKFQSCCFSSPHRLSALPRRQRPRHRSCLPDSRPVLSYFLGHSRFHQNRSSLPFHHCPYRSMPIFPSDRNRHQTGTTFRSRRISMFPQMRQMALPCRIPRQQPQSSFQAFSSFVFLPL